MNVHINDIILPSHQIKATDDIAKSVFVSSNMIFQPHQNRDLATYQLKPKFLMQLRELGYTEYFCSGLRSEPCRYHSF